MKTIPKRIWLLLAAGVALAAGAAALPWRIVIVSGDSMEPAYHSGELLLGTKPGCCRKVPFARGEVVLFRHGNERYLKRIYAIPGDEVVIFRQGDGFNVLIQAENYLRYYRLNKMLPEAKIHRFQVEEGELFLLGDAPHLSLDSRDFGPVPQSAVTARLIR